MVANVGSDNVSVIDLETMEVTATLKVGRFPIGVAIDETRDLAVVTNGEDGNVSLIHLPTPEVVFEVAVGGPAGGGGDPFGAGDRGGGEPRERQRVVDRPGCASERGDDTGGRRLSAGRGDP